MGPNQKLERWRWDQIKKLKDEDLHLIKQREIKRIHKSQSLNFAIPKFATPGPPPPRNIYCCRCRLRDQAPSRHCFDPRPQTKLLVLVQVNLVIPDHGSLVLCISDSQYVTVFESMWRWEWELNAVTEEMNWILEMGSGKWEVGIGNWKRLETREWKVSNMEIENWEKCCAVLYLYWQVAFENLQLVVMGGGVLSKKKWEAVGVFDFLTFCELIVSVTTNL